MVRATRAHQPAKLLPDEPCRRSHGGGTTTIGQIMSCSRLEPSVKNDVDLTDGTYTVALLPAVLYRSHSLWCLHSRNNYRGAIFRWDIWPGFT